MFQERVKDWMMACFGPEISADRMERNHRFLEESLELIQANGCTRGEALQLVDYVYNRPAGKVRQETGGVMVTLAALCLANGISMTECGEGELQRIWGKVAQIRDKQQSKPKHSPLPQYPTPQLTLLGTYCELPENLHMACHLGPCRMETVEEARSRMARTHSFWYEGEILVSCPPKTRTL